MTPITEATGNSFLADTSTRINTCALRIWHDTAVAEETPAQEHADIADALRRHNTYDAVAAVERHNTNADQRYSHLTSPLETPSWVTDSVTMARSSAEQAGSGQAVGRSG